MKKAFGQIKVASSKRKGETLTFTFTNERLMADAAFALRKEGIEIKESFFGYKIFTSVKDVIETARSF